MVIPGGIIITVAFGKTMVEYRKYRDKNKSVKKDIENYKSTINVLSEQLKSMKQEMGKLFEMVKFDNKLLFYLNLFLPNIL